MASRAAAAEREVSEQSPLPAFLGLGTFDEAEFSAEHTDNKDPSCLNILGRVAQIGFSGVGTIALCALRIFKDFGTPINAVVTLGVGLAGQYCIQQIFSRKIINVEKDVLANYNAEIFLVLTQIYLNVPETSMVRDVTFGFFNALLGMQVVSMVHTALNRTLADTRLPETNPLVAAKNTIRIVTGDRRLSRIITEIFKLAISIGCISAGYTIPSVRILTNFGFLFGGHALGSLFYDGFNKLRMIHEKRHSSMTHADSFEIQTIPKQLSFLRISEKTLQVASFILPGLIIAFKTPYTDCITGMGLGLLRQIDIIRFTSTPIDELGELQERRDVTTRTAQRVWDVSKWLFSIIGVGGFLGFSIYQSAQAQAWEDVAALSTFATFLYGSYGLGRFVDTFNMQKSTSSFKNTLFLLFHYSIAAPILYFMINQYMKIGDYALKNYPAEKIILACIAYASLATTLGTNAAKRASKRELPFPAWMNVLIALYANFLVVQLKNDV